MVKAYFPSKKTSVLALVERLKIAVLESRGLVDESEHLRDLECALLHVVDNLEDIDLERENQEADIAWDNDNILNRR